MCGNLSFGVSRCFISYIGLSDYGDYEPLSAAQVALHFLDSDPRPDGQFLQWLTEFIVKHTQTT
jgi:hypothetical protein